MNLAPQFLFGVVVKVYEDNSIEFKIPGVLENMSKFPMAKPVNCHSHPTKEGDTVFITRLYSDLQEFVYQPFDCKAFFGIKNSESVIETKEDTIDIKTSKNVNIRVNGIDVLKISTDSGITKVELASDTTDLINPLLNKSFTCAKCLMTGVDHGTNVRQL